MRFRLSRPLLLTFVSAVRADDEGIDALITVVPTPGVGDDGKPSYKFGVGSVLEKLRDVARDLRQLERLLWRRGSENWAGIGSQSPRRIKVELKLIKALQKLQAAHVCTAFESRSTEAGKVGDSGSSLLPRLHGLRPVGPVPTEKMSLVFDGHGGESHHAHDEEDQKENHRNNEDWHTSPLRPFWNANAGPAVTAITVRCEVHQSRLDFDPRPGGSG